MAQLQFAFWDGVGGYAEQDANIADVYDEHMRLAQRLEELGWHSYVRGRRSWTFAIHFEIVPRIWATH